MAKKIVSLIFLVISIVGAVLIYNSVKWGNKAAGTLLQGSGGMDTSLYAVILQKSIDSYQFLGVALLILGGIGFLLILDSYLS